MRDLKIYIVVALLAVGAFLYIQYNKPAPVNWSKTYVKTDKIPYGTYVLYQELSSFFGNIPVKPYRKRIYNTLEELGNESDSYLLITPELDIDESDYRKLIGFVKAGNDVVIASSYLGTLLADSLSARVSGDFTFTDSLSAVHFTNPMLDTNRQYRFERRISREYFTHFDTAKAKVIAMNQREQAVCLRYPIGKGNLFLVSSPDYFTNYALLKPGGAGFAAILLSHLHPEKQVIWDDFQTQGNTVQQSPMRVFLENEYLRPAYLIALFSLLAFVLYGIKRRQRVIPIVEPLKNTSVEFAKVVSSVYYHRRDNRDLLAKQYTYLMEYIRTTYHITYKEDDTDFIDRLSARTGVDESILLRMLQGMKDVRQNKYITDNALIDHNRNIEACYRQTLWKNNISNNARTSAS